MLYFRVPEDEMAKKRPSASTAKRSARKATRPKRETLAELNTWISANHDALLKKARANCVRLTGKPTFGGNRRKKSA